jgi:hypothetical protein
MVLPPSEEGDMRGYKLTLTIFRVRIENADLERSSRRRDIECNTNARI